MHTPNYGLIEQIESLETADFTVNWTMSQLIHNKLQGQYIFLCEYSNVMKVHCRYDMHMHRNIAWDEFHKGVRKQNLHSRDLKGERADNFIPSCSSPNNQSDEFIDIITVIVHTHCDEFVVYCDECKFYENNMKLPDSIRFDPFP